MEKIYLTTTANQTESNSIYNDIEQKGIIYEEYANGHQAQVGIQSGSTRNNFYLVNSTTSVPNISMYPSQTNAGPQSRQEMANIFKSKLGSGLQSKFQNVYNESINNNLNGNQNVFSYIRGNWR